MNAANDPVRDELEIRSLIARLAQLADESGDDLAEYLDCFTEDAVWESRTGVAGQIPSSPPRRGIAAIREGAMERRRSGLQGPGTRSLHVVTTTVVRLAGDEAQARSYFMYLRDIDSAARVALAGIYDDRFRRTPRGWRYCERILGSN